MPLPKDIQSSLDSLYARPSFAKMSEADKGRRVRSILSKDPNFMKLPSDKARNVAVSRFLNPSSPTTNGSTKPNSTASAPTPPSPTPQPTPASDTDIVRGTTSGSEPQPRTVAKALNFLAPTSPYEAALDAAMMLPIPGMGEGGIVARGISALGEAAPAARMAARVGIPAAEGAAIRGTEAASKGQPIGPAALQGAGELGIPAGAMEPLNAFDTALEAVSPRLNIASAVKASSTVELNRSYISKLSKSIGKYIPELRGKLGDITGLDKLFRGEKASDITGKAVGDLNTQISHKLGENFFIPNIPENLPQHGPKHTMDISRTGVSHGLEGPEVSSAKTGKIVDLGRTFDEVNRDIQFANDAYKLSQTAEEKTAARILKSAAHDTTEYVANFLDSQQAGLGRRWLAVRMSHARARALEDIFREGGLIEGNKLNVQKFQTLLSENANFRADVERLFGGTGDKNDLLEKAFRGAKPTETDITGEMAGLGASIHGPENARAFFHLPTLPKHVGAVPVDLGRNKAVAGMMRLGALRVYHVLLNAAEQQSKQQSDNQPNQ